MDDLFPKNIYKEEKRKENGGKKKRKKDLICGQYTNACKLSVT